MNPLRRLLLPLGLLGLPAALRSAERDPGPYAFFGPLLGGTWVTPDFASQPGHLVHQESTYSRDPAGQGIRGDLYLYEGETLIDHEIDSIVWSADAGRFMEKDGDTLGNVKTGTSRVEDGVLIADITISTPNGQKAMVRSRLSLAGDTLTAKFFHEAHAGAWLQFLELKLKRKP
jgi:hypothetical protein